MLQWPFQRMTRARSSCSGVRPPRGLPPVPGHHLLEGDAHLVAGVASEVLVGEEEHLLAALEGVLERLGGVAGGADDALALAHERLEAGGAVHVRDWDDARAGAEGGGHLVPGRVDIAGIGHVGHGAAGGHVGEDDGDVGRREDVGGFGHEVDAAEEDELDALLAGGVLGELEAVAGEVGVLDHFVALVVVAEDDETIAEGGAGIVDALLKLRGGEAEVAAGDVLLPTDKGRLLHEGEGLKAVGGAGVRVRIALKQGHGVGGGGGCSHRTIPSTGRRHLVSQVH